MPVVGSLANASARGLGWGLFASEGNAFELVKPSSVVVTGGGSETATISALGSVEFSAAETLSLNDVFSSDYDNYMVVCRAKTSATFPNTFVRLRAGTDNSTASSYVTQVVSANSTTVNGSRTTSNQWDAAPFASVESGVSMFLYGPNLVQPTAMRQVAVVGYLNALIYEIAGTHNQSTAYDGFTFIPFSGTNFSGRVAVYGMRG